MGILTANRENNMKKILYIIVPLLSILTACNSGSNVGGTTSNYANQASDTATNNQLSLAELDATQSLMNMTWMGGSSKTNFQGIYGTKGLRDKNIMPGARSNFAMWHDNNGLIWIFGGTGASGQNANLYNDLWNYDPKTQTWDWIAGSNKNNQDGVYGVKNLPAAANTPGARYGTYSWTDKSGNFWLFGGSGQDNKTQLFNDLWKFDTITQQWMWVSGSNQHGQQSIYGSTIGSESSGYTPGARFGGVSWSDESGNLWLFGGDSINNGAEYYRNDVWRFNTTTNKWALMSPIATASIQTKSGGAIATFGTLNVETNTNTPPGLLGSAAWVDSSGNAWIFGGMTYNSKKSVVVTQNALWKFNLKTRLWTWAGGNQTAGQASVAGDFGVESSSYVPGARYYTSSWTDANGNFWLINGDSDTAGVKGDLADIWRYNPNTKKWAVMGGNLATNQQVVYNTLGVPSSTNFIGSRISPGVVYDKDSNSVWLFGGTSETYPYADLWNITSVDAISVELSPLPKSNIKWNNTLENIPGNQFGLSGFLFTNKSNFQLASINMAQNFPSNEFWFDSYRSTCLVDGTSQSITLEPNSSCSLIIHYEPTVLSYTGMLKFAVQAQILNSTSTYKTNEINTPYSSRAYAKCNVTGKSWEICK